MKHYLVIMKHKRAIYRPKIMFHDTLGEKKKAAKQHNSMIAFCKPTKTSGYVFMCIYLR